MKTIKHLILIALLAAFNTAEACTNFLITKGASVDGSNFISYCADSHIRYGELYFTPAADWPEGRMRICFDRGTNAPRGGVPQPHHTYQVVGYINEYNHIVVIYDDISSYLFITRNYYTLKRRLIRLLISFLNKI